MIDPNIAYSVLPTCLGWLKGLWSWIWQALNGGGSGGMLGWISRNWIILTVVLCLIGAAADLAVYLFRWRPDVVWRSFIRRLREGPVEEPPEQPEDEAYYSPDEIYEPEEPREEQQTEREPLHRKLPHRAGKLAAKLLEATRSDGTDEVTRLATYRPVMKTDKSHSFREPVYPTAPTQDPSDQPK